jgi:hypothetical protein
MHSSRPGRPGTTLGRVEGDTVQVFEGDLFGGPQATGEQLPLADMFFPPAELVWRLSQDMTLEPGDLIRCGTSLGVLPMKPGTTVEVAVDGLGTLRNVYG